MIELAGLTAVPGLIDSHAHFMGLGQSRMVLDLRDAPTWDEIVSMVREAAATAKPGEWIRGRGWHQEKWTSVPQPNVEGFPLHDTLSQVSPGQPRVPRARQRPRGLLQRQGARGRGITAATRNPPGGEILKDRAGRPTGLLRETASDLAEQALADWLAQRTPEEQAEDARRTIQLAVTRACATASRRSTTPARASPRSTC